MFFTLLGRTFQYRHLVSSLQHLLKDFSSKSCSVPLMASGEKTGLPLNDVVAKLNSFAAVNLAESWDNVGLLVEPITKKNIETILLTNDLTEDVMDEALQVKADLILSYHPPIFSALKSVTNRTWKERIIGTCLENRIAIYSPHTSFDAVTGGVNDWLASAFDTESVQPLIQSYSLKGNVRPYQVEITSSGQNPSVLSQLLKTAEMFLGDDIIGNLDTGGNKLTMSCSKSSLPKLVEVFNGLPLKISKFEEVPLPGIGMGRLCMLNGPVNVQAVVELVKKHLGLQHLRLALAKQKSLQSPVQTVALCAGSGSSVLRGVKADLYLTGEMGHHDVLDAVHKGIHVILCDHSNTERGFLRGFSQTLSKEILEGKTEVIMSNVDRDPLQIL